MEEVNWSGLNKILNDPIRRSILGLLAENRALTYTEIMTILHVTNTGKLNYHLKSLDALVAKDEEGKYYLTERGKLAASLLKTFPEKDQVNKNRPFRIMIASLWMIVGIAFISFASILFVSTPPTLEHYALDVFLMLIGAFLIGLAIFSLISKSTVLRGQHFGLGGDA